MAASVETTNLLHELVEMRAGRQPSAPAVSCATGQLSYRELTDRAGLLATRLRAQGVGTEDVVGVLTHRQLALPVAILGVLKAGAAYLPLTADLPEQRLAELIADAGVRTVVSSPQVAGKLARAGVSVVTLTDTGTLAEQSLPVEQVGPAAGPDPLGRAGAYVIYTSGSTGIPKGVLVPHAAATAHIRSVVDRFGLSPADVVLQMAGHAFDVAVEQLFAGLAAGARVLLRDDRPWGPAEVCQALREHRVTVADLPTAIFAELTTERHAAGLRAALGHLRAVLVGGEALPAPALTRWHEVVGPQGPAVINAYGPTEAVMTATVHQATAAPGGADAQTVPIGTVLGPRTLHVLDAELAAVTDGSAGELYLGGAALARGYLGRPGLTATTFVPDPHGPPGSRMYRTGDRVRQTGPGPELTFLGRVDDQVKVRGYRIEPGEVEHVLLSHPGIAQVAVVVRDGRLAAHLSATSDRPDPAELASWLTERLPRWMVPSTWHYLDRLPLTASGKVDRVALAAREPAGLTPSRTVRPTALPDDPVTRQLCLIWQRVLDLPAIDVQDTLFDLGGTSLLAARIQADIRADLGVELPLHALLANPTVAALAPLVAAAQASGPDAAGSLPVLERYDGDRGSAPLSVMQEQIWYFEQLTPGNVAYNAPTTIRLHGPVDPDLLTAALTEVVRRHEILRTTIELRDGEPTQVIHPPYQVRIATRDLRGESDPGAVAEQLVAQEIRHRFELGRLPLLRWTLLRLADEEYELILVEHHIIHDGWSFAVLMEELFANYSAVAGWSAPPPEPPLQYADYAQWQRRALTGPAMRRQQEHLRQRLAGAPDQLELPYDFPRGDPEQAPGAQHRMELPADVCAAARDFSRTSGVTLFTTMLAAYVALLHRLTGQDELCVGSAYGNRAVPGTHGVLGMFVNPVVLRCEVPGEESFTGLVDRVRSVTLDAQSHQELPFVQLVRELAPPRRPGHNPMFAAMLNFDDAPLTPLRAGPISATYLERHNGTAKLDLSVLVVPRAERQIGVPAADRDQRITMIWEYRSDLFDPATIDRIAAGYVALLRAALADPGNRVDELPAGTQPATASPAVPGAASRAVPVPASAADDLPLQLFARQVAARPDAGAVHHPGYGAISYAELDRRANQLAHRLRATGVGPEEFVAIRLPRSVEFVVAVLGALKSGAAYLPLDPESPPERLAGLLADARPRVVITNERLPAEVTGTAVQLDPGDPALAAAPEHDPQVTVDPDQLAYLIYTSGSTGRPKAVGITHRALGRKYLAWRGVYELDRHPGVHLQVAAVAFDVCTGDLVRALLSGGQLVLCPPAAVLDPAALAAVLRDHRVDCVELLPSVMGLLAGHLTMAGETLPDLRLVAVGGESWTAADLRRFRAVLGPTTRILNVYGVTEVTIGNTWRELPGELPEGTDERSLPIGGPLPEVLAVVLDRAGRVTPVGVVGEIYLGGVGVARGYHGRAGLTAQRFIPDPTPGAPPGARLYATGDRGRYLPDGDIEFLGRNDQQVKVRGFRVEPGEVEHALRAHPAVTDAAVVARAVATGVRLDGYVTVSDLEATPTALRDFLRGRLPAYLVPAGIRVLAELPRTSSGKLDRRALPALDVLRDTIGPVSRAPRPGVEQRVAEVWQEVLGIDSIGADDDFFDLGGHSLLAAKVTARLRAVLDVRLPVRELLAVPTVAGVAHRIEQVGADARAAGRGPALVARARRSYTVDAAAFDGDDAGPDSPAGTAAGNSAGTAVPDGSGDAAVLEASGSGGPGQTWTEAG